MNTGYQGITVRLIKSLPFWCAYYEGNDESGNDSCVRCSNGCPIHVAIEVLKNMSEDD